MSNNLTNQKIKDTYGRLVQSVSGSFYNGFGDPITITTTSASYALTASYISGSISNAISASYALNASTAYQANIASYALTAQTLLGTVETASYAIKSEQLLGGSSGYIPVWNSNTSQTGSIIFQSGSFIIINDVVPSPTNPEALHVHQIDPTSVTVITGRGSIDNYLQLNVKNENNGTNASSDIVATANNGDETTFYIDMGINSDNYAGFLGGANDAYMYSVAENLYIGNYGQGKKLYLFNSESLEPVLTLDGNQVAVGYNVAHPTSLFYVKGNAYVETSLTASIFKGDLEGTASLALTASYFSGSISNAVSASYALTASYIEGGGGAGASGISGLQGISGISGLSGQNGVSGISGLQGDNGTSGISGLSGANGASGISGLNGINGVSGISGISGINGTAGTSGISGLEGTSGISGLSGANGTSGISGLSGNTGTSGISGLSGTSGISGISGVSSLQTKASSVANTSFTGNPKKATVTFSAAYGSNNYAVTVTGEDARSWTIESKSTSGFTINSNSNTSLSGTTFWISMLNGES